MSGKTKSEPKFFLKTILFKKRGRRKGATCGVDEFEDTKAHAFHKLQQSSIGSVHPVETMHVENKAFSRNAQNCLGLLFTGLSKSATFNNLQATRWVLCWVQRYNSDYSAPDFRKLELFKGLPRFKQVPSLVCKPTLPEFADAQGFVSTHSRRSAVIYQKPVCGALTSHCPTASWPLTFYFSSLADRNGKRHSISVPAPRLEQMQIWPIPLLPERRPRRDESGPSDHPASRGSIPWTRVARLGFEFPGHTGLLKFYEYAA